MKFKMQFRTWAGAGLLLVSVALADAQQSPAGSFPPVTDMPTLARLPAPQGTTPLLDPNTGLPAVPLASAEPQWIDTNWGDPDIILTNVVYDSLPLSEVARQLREQFKNDFDILPIPQTFRNDWGTTIINLQLKNVRASEVFNAMNLVFENDRTPLRWELKASGGRPLILLRVLAEAAPKPAPGIIPPETHRMVYFIGNLVGDEKNGGLTVEQLIQTITDVWPADFGKPDGVVQFHKDAQLLVVNGTRDQLEFLSQTLRVLQEKAEWARFKQKSGGTNSTATNSKGDSKSNRSE